MNDVLPIIFHFAVERLNLREFVSLSRVCKSWNRIHKQDAIWLHMCKHHYYQEPARRYLSEFINIHKAHCKLNSRCKLESREFGQRNDADIIYQLDLKDGDIINLQERRNLRDLHVCIANKLHEVYCHSMEEMYIRWLDSSVEYVCDGRIFKFPEFPPAYWSNIFDIVYFDDFDPTPYLPELIANLKPYQLDHCRNHTIHISSFHANYVNYEVIIISNDVISEQDRNHMKTLLHHCSKGSKLGGDFFHGLWMYVHDKHLRIGNKLTCYDMYKRFILYRN